MDSEEIFFKIFVIKSPSFPQNRTLKAAWFNTPLGSMIAIGDEASLYFLDFLDRHDLKLAVDWVRQNTKAAIIPGLTSSFHSIKKEVNQYFEGGIKEFKTPLFFLGTSFQKQVWKELFKIPYGKTVTYAEVATRIGRPSACRAVAQATGANRIVIAVPCHRVVAAHGGLGGYRCGLSRKIRLLQHEQGLIFVK